MAVRPVLEGDDALRRILKALPAAVAGENIGRAVLAGAYIIETAAKQKAPVDTGALRNSIFSEIVSVTASSAEAVTAASVLYAIYVEYGTKNMSAQPYLRPAVDENLGSITRAVTTVFRDLILAAAR